MIIDDITFKNSLVKLNNGEFRRVHWKYAAEFINDSNNVISVLNVVALYRLSNFAEKTNDHLAVTVQVSKSVSLKLKSGVNRRELKLRLVRTENSVYGQTKTVGVSQHEIYRAYLTDYTSEPIETRVGGLSGAVTDDLAELIELDVQLLEMGFAEFRLKETSGVCRNADMASILKAEMSAPVKALGNDNNTGYDVDVYQVANPDKTYQMVIPSGTKIIDLPKYIQKEKGGLYSAGLGRYLGNVPTLTGGKDVARKVNKMWYIYPLYDFTRYNKSAMRMTIINVPRNEMLGIENSYVIDGQEIYIYATGDTKHIDRSVVTTEKTGTGLKALKTGNALKHQSVTSKGVTGIPKGRNVIQFGLDNRPSELNDIRLLDKKFTSNIFDAVSNFAKNQGVLIQVTWENSNPYLLLPGMPTKFIYKDMGIPHMLYGTLFIAETLDVTRQAAAHDTRYVSTTTLTLFCEREDSSLYPLPPN